MSWIIPKYLHHNKLSSSVSIEQRIKAAKNPTIIIDMMYYDQLEGYLQYNSTTTKMRDLCGISRVRVKQLEDFVAKMKGWGAELIFITNGAFFDTSGQIIPDENDAKGVSSKDWRYQLQCAMIDYLADAHYSQVAQDAKFVPIERIWTESVVKIAWKYGKVLWAWDNTRHQEIIKYASVHNVLAIISKHFPLLLYSGSSFPKYKLWSCVDCCEAKMTTKEFDPLVIRRTLGLSAKQMRLLAALSDRYVATPTYYGFLARLKLTEYQRNVFGHLVKYVKKTAGNLQELDYLKIARDLFGEEKYIEKFDEFKTVCESYDINKITLSMEQNNDLISLQLKKQDSFNYDIYHGIKFTVSVTFVDYRYWLQQGVDFFELVMGLYRRICGVILQHKKDPTLVRYVSIKRSHPEDYAVFDLEPEYPRGLNIPSLQVIFTPSVGEAANKMPQFNINLLEFITDMELPRYLLEFFWKTDQRTQLQDCLTLRFMVQMNMLDRFEADIMLLASNKCRNEKPKDYALPEKLNLRAFHLYFTFIKMRSLMKHCFYAAGLDGSFMDECYIDGIVFQVFYHKWNALGENDEFREKFAHIKQFRLH